LLQQSELILIVATIGIDFDCCQIWKLSAFLQQLNINVVVWHYDYRNNINCSLQLQQSPVIYIGAAIKNCFEFSHRSRR